MLTGFTFCIPIKNKSAEEASQLGEILFISHSSYVGSYLRIMGQSLKMICSILLQSNLEWRERSTHHHTGLNQMVTLRVFTIS